MSEPPPTTVDEAAADLYGGPLDRFVADRDATVKALRAAGDKDLAVEVKALRKPTVAADALNRALRADPEAVEALLTAAADLQQAQEAALGGDRTDFPKRQADYRAAIDTIAANAPSHHDEVRSGVEAAVLSDLGDDLRDATFAAMPIPSGGFGPFELGPVVGKRPKLTVVPDLPDQPDKPAEDKTARAKAARAAKENAAKEKAARQERKEAQRQARKVLMAAKAEQRVAEESARSMAKVIAGIDGELDQLRQRQVELVEARDAAAAELTVAESKLEDAQSAVEQAQSLADGLAD